MRAPLVTDIGFFDTTKTGDITSRLSSDTTLVGDQYPQRERFSTIFCPGHWGADVHVFRFLAAFNPGFHLSACHYCTVKVVWEFCSQSHQSDAKEGKSLGICCGHSRAMSSTNTLIYNLQLADGNSVSEAAISSMPTVRAFDAAPTEFKEFEACMEQYLSLNMKSAVAYSGYATCVTSLPQLVTALVVFYGGLMVRTSTRGFRRQSVQWTRVSEKA